MELISGAFLLFIAVVTAVYYALPGKAKPVWLLIASLFFYVSADWRFLPFLLLSAGCTWLAARKLPGSKRRKGLLWLTLAVDVGLLAVLKLLPFGWMFAGRFLGQLPELRFIYPLGIAFYSLQAAGYLIDVYRGKTQPEQSFWRFLLFMCFFPIISQGPISRYEQLAPQLNEPHALQYKNLAYGAQLALWGFFKKLVIADRAAILVDQVYGNYTEYAGIAIFLAAVLYFIQLYTDFSGCVDICRGAAQMLGIELAENFRRPFLSASTQEFWRRWHISLSFWLRDYLYFPLGGSRLGKLRKNTNLLIVFTVSGIWHGTGLNYMLWGLLQGVYQIVGAATRGARDSFWKKLRPDGAPRPLRQIGCFLILSLTAHIVRAPGLRTGWQMARAMAGGFSLKALTDGSLLALGLDGPDMLVLVLAMALLLGVSLWQEKHVDALLRDRLAALPLGLRWGIWLVGLAAVLILGVYGPGYSSAQFIYMAF